MNPAAIYGAGKAINQIGSYLGQKSAAQKRQEQIDAEIARLEGKKKEEYLDVGGIFGGYQRQLIEQSAKSGRKIDKILGLDVGQAQGGIAERLAGKTAGLYSDLKLTDETGRQRRDERIDERISGLKMGQPTQPSAGNLLAGLAGTGLETYGGIQQQNQAKADVLKQQSQAFDLSAANQTREMLSMGGGQPTEAPAYDFDAQKFEKGRLSNEILQARLNEILGGGGGKVEQPPTSTLSPTQTTSMTDKFIKGRQADILAKDGEGYSYQDLQQDAERGLEKTSGWFGFGDPTPDYTKQKELEQYQWYSDPANRQAIVDDSLRVMYPERFPSQGTGLQGTGLDDPKNTNTLQGFLPAGVNQSPLTQAGRTANQFGEQFGARTSPLPQEFEDIGIKMASDWNELTRDEKIQYLRIKGVIQ